MTKLVEERFWAKVDKTSSPNGCWLFTGAKQKKSGYGRAHLLGENLAHRVTPDGLQVQHLCNNPPCVNPAHLELGNQAKNLAYMKACGRSQKGRLRNPALILRGEASPSARLTLQKVHRIRKLYSTGKYTMRDLAHKFGASSSTIFLVVSGTTWKEAVS
jgi:hypothetical protein